MKSSAANFRLAVATSLLASLFFAVVLTVAPGSHHLVHKEAGTAQHECAVTLIASGKYEVSDGPVLVSSPNSPVRWAKVPSVHTVWVAVPFLGASIFEHAPPALV